MLLLDTTRKILPDFKGTFNKGDEDAIPLDHLIDSLNVEFSPGRVFTRRGTSVRKSFAGGGVRSAFYQFHKAGSAPVIFSSDTGNIYQEDTVKITAALTSFAAAQLFGKLFISPRTETQGVGDLYLYDDANAQFRKAGGDKPSGTIMVAVDGAAGVVPAGTRKLAVSYLTETGFLTPPGPIDTGVFVPTTYTGPGSLKINVSNIPVGPAGDRIVARYILSTRADEEEYFFVPEEKGGVINDNTTTTTILDFFDTDLIESADYLFDLLERPPAGVGMLVYAGRLVVFGFPSPDGSLARVSRAGEPESFSDIDGFVIVSKDDGYNLTAAAVIREVLYLGKEKGIYSTEDNGEEPATWDVNTVDEAIGIIVDGVSQVSPAKPQGTHNDVCIIADKSALYLFDGIVRHPELTWKVSKIWDDEFNGTNLSIVFDVSRRLVLVTGVNNGILVGNYIDGISPEKIVWTKWSFPETVLFGGLLDSDTGTNPEYIFSTATTKQLLKFDTTTKRDTNLAINSYGQTALVSFEEGELQYLSGIHYKVQGAKNLFTTVIGYDDPDAAKREILAPIQLVEKPGITYKRYSKFVNEKASIKFAVNELDSWFSLSKMILYGRPMFQARPQ